MASEVDVKIDRSTEIEPRMRPLDTGWRKAQLIRQLAMGDLNQAQLGEMYCVTQQAISRFKQRYGMEIAQVRYNLAEKVQEGSEHLWVAQKLNRIAEYQSTAERMNQLDTPRSHEIKITAIKAVAEELGDLPARTQINVDQSTVTYEIVGIPLEDI